MRKCEKRESCISETLDTDLIALAFLLLRKRKKRSGNRRRILSRKVLPLLQKSTRYFCWGENTTKKNATQHVEAYSGLCKTETYDNTKTGVQFPHSLKKKSLKSLIIGVVAGATCRGAPGPALRVEPRQVVLRVPAEELREVDVAAVVCVDLPERQL